MFNNSNNLSLNIPTSASVGAIPNPVDGGAYVFYFQPVGGTTLSTVGGAITGSTTVSTAITPGSSNFGKFRRARGTSASSINSPGAMTTAYTRWFRGAGGGFDAYFQFSLGANTTGNSAFVGFSTLIAGLTLSDPTTLTDCAGIGFVSTDASTSTWFIINNDSSGVATKTAITGMTRTTGAGYNMRITCPDGASSNITLIITDALTNAIVLPATAISTNLPTANTLMSIGAHTCSGSTSTASVIDVSRIYVTSQF
jgi:hypothetical protein